MGYESNATDPFIVDVFDALAIDMQHVFYSLAKNTPSNLVLCAVIIG